MIRDRMEKYAINEMFLRKDMCTSSEAQGLVCVCVFGGECMMGKEILSAQQHRTIKAIKKRKC